MNIAIIDDDKEFLEMIQKKIKERIRIFFDNYEIKVFSDTNNLFKETYDIYFLDIDLLNESGFEIANIIKNNNSNAIILFITSRSDLIFTAITTQPFYFIRKTNLNKDLNTAFVLLQNHYKNKMYYIIKDNNEDIKILVQDIIYIKTTDHLTSIYTKTKHYHIYKTLKEVIADINYERIIQISKNCCVNLLNISNIKGNNITTINNIILKIGRTYKYDVVETYSNMYIKEKR